MAGAVVNIKFLLFIYFCVFRQVGGFKSATNHTFNVIATHILNVSGNANQLILQLPVIHFIFRTMSGFERILLFISLYKINM